MKIKDDVIRLTEQYERMDKVIRDYNGKKRAMSDEINELKRQILQLDANRAERLRAYLAGNIDSYDHSTDFPDLNSLKSEIIQRESDLNQAVAFIDENIEKLANDKEAIREAREIIISKAWVKLMEAELPQFKESFYRIFRHFIGASKIFGASAHVPNVYAFTQAYFVGQVLGDKELNLEPLKKSADDIFFKEYGVKPVV